MALRRTPSLKQARSARSDLTFADGHGHYGACSHLALVVLSNGLKGQTFPNSLINIAYRRERWPFQ